MKPTRRQMLRDSTVLAAIGALFRGTAEGSRSRAEAASIATNTYPWLTFARREQREFHIHSDQLLGDIAKSGIESYEPIIEKVNEFNGLGDRLKRHGLSMKSLYVNSVLHDADRASQSVDDVLEIATAAADLGVNIIVTNPSPISWGGSEDKSDAQLRIQARNLDLLGGEIRKLGMQLAYHNHDAELRQGGREFHHMLTATNPHDVRLCLDAHWVYRGCGNSEVAVFDALHHYHERIVELHLRQSQAGVWTESFSMAGDIDYTRLFTFLRERDVKPHLVLEQAVEAKSARELTAVEAHTASCSALQSAIS